MGNSSSRETNTSIEKRTTRPVVGFVQHVILNSTSNITKDFLDGIFDQKRYDPGDSSLRLVDREDEMDFECHGYDSPRAEMSCGHTVTPQSLTDWCFRQLDQGQCNFVCGHCNSQWSIQEVYKMALLTPEKAKDLETKIFENAAQNFLEIKRCPGCNYLVSRKSTNDLSVKCSQCTAKKGSTYKFCWQCMKEWKGRAPRTDGCDNIDCQSPLKILAKCPYINFVKVKGVHDCPSIRACPNCGILLEHNKQGCKRLVCTRCKTSFCFVCLSTTQECLGSPFQKCPNEVAPRQTTIPVWKLKK